MVSYCGILNSCPERSAGDQIICGPRVACHTSQEHAVGTYMILYVAAGHQDPEGAKQGNTINASNYPIKQKAARGWSENAFSRRAARVISSAAPIRGNAQQLILQSQPEGGKNIEQKTARWIYSLHTYTRLALEKIISWLPCRRAEQ